MVNALSRAACVAGALVGAASFSQYPAFTQDYIQRLGGTVDALTKVADDFDRSALEAGLTRSQALAELSGSAFRDARAADMRQTFVRQARLTEHLNRLRAATPLERVTLAPSLRDPATLQATWADFEPALPLSTAGAVTGGIGFVGGWLALAGALALIKVPFRRRKTPQPVRQRIDPPLMRSMPNTPTPRLPGETRPQ